MAAVVRRNRRSKFNGHNDPTPKMMKFLAGLSPVEAEKAERENWPSEKVSQTIDALKNEQRSRKRQDIPDHELLDAAHFIEEHIAPPRCVIPGLLYEGLTLLVANPKAGKSLLVLMFLFRLARRLNQDISGSGLYLALEDSRFDLQQRMRNMLQGTPLGEGLVFLTFQSRTVSDGLIEQLERDLKDHPEISFVVLDTYAKIKPTRGSSKDISAYDRDSLEGLRDLAYTYHVAILIVHHTNKRIAHDDPFDKIAGTQQLRAVVDNIFMLVRTRGETVGKLYTQGRNVQELDIDLTLDDFSGIWTSDFFEDTPEIESNIDAVVRVLSDAGTPLSPKEIGKRTAMDGGQVRVILNRLLHKGRVVHSSHGLWKVAEYVNTSEHVNTLGNSDNGMIEPVEPVQGNVNKHTDTYLSTNFVNNSTNEPVEPVHRNSEFSELVNTSELVNNASNGSSHCIQCGSTEYRIEDDRLLVCAACNYAIVK